MSEDGRTALVVIAMLGNAFSPYYARARAAAPADPMAFTTMNVALYDPKESRWALTERHGAARSADTLAIGPSSIRHTPSGWELSIDECAAVGRKRVKGKIVVRALSSFGEPQWLDARGLHRWWPIAPLCQVEVTLEEPRLVFRGRGYFDANSGDEPLEAGFRSWNWSRSAGPEAASIAYCVERRDGSRKAIDLAFDARGARAVEGAAERPLAKTRWGVPRTYRGAPSDSVQVVRALEDTPFYSRSQLEARNGSQRASVIHESVCLERFQRPWVQFLLPMRMRRVAI